MSQKYRTPKGGRIDRSTPLNFTFDGRRLTGFAGDTLASALLANGVHLVGRSFKYHRPRGILAAGSEEPNALVTVDRGNGRTTPNLRATQVELYEGLAAHSQNRWPSLGFDVGAINDRMGSLFSAGFYYKTFMGPRAFGLAPWTKLFEPLIRRAAGLGRAPHDPDPDRYACRFAHCDVLVVGAGPAGLAAALAAAESGARVIVCDEQAELGGSLLAETTARIDGHAAQAWLAETLAALVARENVTLLPRTQAFGYYADNFVALAQSLTDHLSPAQAGDRPREKLWQVRATEVVLATGAIERPLVFAGNDRPGVMLADAARIYLTRYGVRAGTRILVATAHDEAYGAALDLAQAGASIALIADLRPDPQGPLVDTAQAAGIRIETATTIVETSGRRHVSRARIGHRGKDGTLRASEAPDVDLVLMSGGWTPSVHLFSQSRGKLAFDPATETYLPSQSAQRERAVGGARGVFALGDVLADGFRAGEEAVKDAGFKGAPRRSATVENALESFGGKTAEFAAPQGKAFVDFQNDVTAKDLALATREGFQSIEHVKRYTTTGMATDQGKTSNINALSIVSRAIDKPIPEIGLTTFRPPYTPVTFGTLAGMSRGMLFDPVRETPIHSWAAEQGAVFEDVGTWKRAHYFPRNGEDMHAAVRRECKAVRSVCGIFDGTTLGKIEVVGKDAAEFLERIYVNPFAKLAAGRCRYGVMLNEAGFIVDDGVIGRLAFDRFHVTTTTGGAAHVLATMEDYRQTEWPDLDVSLTSVTEQWAVIAVQGPNARHAILPLVDNLPLDSTAFPHMAVTQTRVCGVPARLFRVSFTGEAGYEINVPADYGRAVWEQVYTYVQAMGGCAYGTETMHVLRAEKGYIIVGQETDGTVTPDDVGLAWAIGKNKKDFVGKRSLTRPDMLKTDRPQLVGLLTADRTTQLEEGAQIVAQRNAPRGTPALGHVTSSYWSVALERPIALALVAGGRARLGETLQVPMPGGDVAVDVVSPVFVDEKGERLHV